MKTLNTLIIKLTACLIVGILCSHFFEITFRFSFYCIASAFIVLCLAFTFSLKTYRKSIWFGLVVYLFMIALGTLTYTTHNQKNFKQHYTQLKHKKSSTHSTLILSIRERLKPSLYHNKYVVNLHKLDSLSVSGKLLFNVEKDSSCPQYSIDDVLIIHTSLNTINPSLNPNQFDYKRYLEKQYIYHQVSVGHSSILRLQTERKSLFGFAEALRQHINQKLGLYNFKIEELAIINALILGQRQDMDKTIYEDYANAGAIHILAVSGLHVGIILLLLNVFLKPIERLKHGKFIKVCLIILLLWSFAIIAGLSASVTRAVTMFSIVAIAMHLKRQTNIYNTLAISVFILLLCKPMFLFDVGFQMSYLAVIAIVSIQPMLYKLWSPKWKIIDYFWQIFTVTIAAQFGVVPVSLFYFHQFPGLFFVSNLAIIPCLGLILGLGILVIILALANSLPEFLANAYGGIISSMNWVVSWVSSQEQFLFKTISFNLQQVVVSYVLITSLVLLFSKRNFKHVVLFLVSILCIQAVTIYNAYNYSKPSLIIFHKSRYSLIAEKSNSKLSVYDNFDSITSVKDRIITNFKVGNFVDSTERDTIKNVYQFQNKTLLIVDSLGVYTVKRFQPDYVLLRNSPRLNLERLIDSIHPKYIIADGSNYKSYVKRWEATCIKRKLPFYYTGKTGAFIIN